MKAIFVLSSLIVLSAIIVWQDKPTRIEARGPEVMLPVENTATPVYSWDGVSWNAAATTSSMYILNNTASSVACSSIPLNTAVVVGL